jgi:hypothetical protein
MDCRIKSGNDEGMIQSKRIRPWTLYADGMNA